MAFVTRVVGQRVRASSEGRAAARQPQTRRTLRLALVRATYSARSDDSCWDSPVASRRCSASDSRTPTLSHSRPFAWWIVMPGIRCLRPSRRASRTRRSMRVASSSGLSLGMLPFPLTPRVRRSRSRAAPASSVLPLAKRSSTGASGVKSCRRTSGSSPRVGQGAGHRGEGPRPGTSGAGGQIQGCDRAVAAGTPRRRGYGPLRPCRCKYVGALAYMLLVACPRVHNG